RYICRLKLRVLTLDFHSARIDFKRTLRIGVDQQIPFPKSHQINPFAVTVINIPRFWRIVVVSNDRERQTLPLLLGTFLSSTHVARRKKNHQRQPNHELTGHWQIPPLASTQPAESLSYFSQVRNFSCNHDLAPSLRCALSPGKAHRPFSALYRLF